MPHLVFRNALKLVRKFLPDRSGNYLIILALLAPVLITLVGLGTDYGIWVYNHQALQAAAQSAAVSAATAGANLDVEAEAITATYGFINGANGVTVTVNQPPRSGTHTKTSGAVEVIMALLQAPGFSAVLNDKPFTITGRAVAVPNGGVGCVLALDSGASGAISLQGSPQITLTNCGLYDNSNDGTALSIGGAASLSAFSVSVVGGISGASAITATHGIKTGAAPASDPYAAVSFPPFFGCDHTNFSAKSDTTINPGVYCGGMSLSAGAAVTLNPGVYYLDQGNLDVTSNATLTGSGVTLVFTSSTGRNWATASIGSNATITLSAPTTGPTAGIVMFGDRNMTVGTSFRLSGGSTQSLGGAVYLPKAALTYTGGSSTSTGCTQIIADTIAFKGNSSLAVKCGGLGTNPVGAKTASLVE